MKARNESLWCVSAAMLLLTASPAFASHTRGALMTVDTTDQACVQLKDNNTWTSSLTDMTGVGTNYTLNSFVSGGHLNVTASTLTSSDHPHAAGYAGGFKWSSGDESTSDWSPQGLTIGSGNGDELAFISWNWSGSGTSLGSRISIADVANLNNVTYRHVIMVLPTGAGTYAPIAEHAGGIGAFVNNLLYVSEGSGLHVFDMNNIREVSTTNCTTSGGSPIFGKNSAGDYCAGGYEFIVPQVDEYYVPSTMENGTAISASCTPKFSFAGVDWRQATDYMLSGEYCGPAADASPCQGDLTYLNGRLYMWPLSGSTGKLIVDAAGYVAPYRVYFMNESDVQGVATDDNKYTDSGGNLVYPTETFFLSATYNGSEIYRVSPNTATATWSYAAGTAAYHSEGMYTTTTPNMWISTEGNNGAGTDPATTGRSVFYVHQSSY